MVLLSVAVVLFSILVSLNAYMHAVLHEFEIFMWEGLQKFLMKNGGG